MRPRSGFVAVFSIAAFAIAGCTSEPGVVATPGASIGQGSTTNPASAGPVTGGADRQAVCAGYQKAEAEAQAKLLSVIPKAAEALADPSKAPAVMAELKQVMVGMETAFAAEAARSADAELRTAIDADVTLIRQVIKDIDAAGNSVDKGLTAIQTEQFETAGEKVKSLCVK